MTGFDRESQSQSQVVSESPAARLDSEWVSADALRLAGYSFLILFFELALIRYISAYVRVFGFYLNFVLIGTFLGMGVGLMRSQMADRLKWAGPFVGVALLAVVKYFSNVVVEVPPDPDEYVWGVFFEIAPSVRRIGILPTVTILFVTCVAFFVPLGASLGQVFGRFRPLYAYSIDIGGSLAGILLFGVLSVLGLPPVVWFGLGCAVWVALSLRAKSYAVLLGAAGIVMTSLAHRTAATENEYWSPYYRINVHEFDDRHSLHVNGSMHQWIINFDSIFAEQSDLVRRIKQDYRLPFQFLRVPDTVLVVGAGTGNDVALLLDLGVKHVDAVEIDPIILALGRELHRQQPYADPRVQLHNTDAREFLRNTARTYDLIVFGTLDSQTLLSGMSSLRLDNYVYTIEAFQEARKRLKVDGNIVTYHMSPFPYIAAKIAQMIAIAFDQIPAVRFEPNHVLFNNVFLAGAAADSAKTVWGPPNPALFNEVELPSDNWPYLYLSRPTIPTHYQRALLSVLFVGLIAVGVGGGRQVVRGFDWTMFFMGAGFLLLETKSVSEMSLLFGTTWQVNLLVFSSILLVILGANLLVLKYRPKRLHLVFLGLFASLALAFVIPVRGLLWFGTMGQWLAGGVVVALPIFFAAILFATLFQNRENATGALAANVLGAVVGGVAEYLSMLLGVKGLYLIGALAYAAVYWMNRPRRTNAYSESRLPMTPEITQ